MRKQVAGPAPAAFFFVLLNLGNLMPPEASASPGLTETLANLNIFYILAIVAVLTVLRLALVGVKNAAARSVAEIFESGMIAVALVFLIIRPFILQAFYIPSPSMEPTLLGKNNSGDRILVNKFEYRTEQPHRDDVVVFRAPPAATRPDLPDDSEFIKRLIAMPGDRLEVHGGYMIVGGLRINHFKLRQTLAQAGVFGVDAQNLANQDIGIDQADHHAKYVPNGVMADAHLVTKEQLSQIFSNMPHTSVEIHPGYTVLNGTTLKEPFIAEDPDYDLKISDGQSLKNDFGTNSFRLQGESISPSQFALLWAKPTEPLPAGHYMMMGDNRNDSKDSTEWGPLEAARVVGRAQFIFWPLSRLGVIH